MDSQIILSQRCPSEQQTEWAFQEILEICSEHASHNEYIELVVEHIPALVRCVKPYGNGDMHDNLIQLISKVLKRCKTKKLSHFACLKIIRGVEYFAQVWKQEKSKLTQSIKIILSFGNFVRNFSISKTDRRSFSFSRIFCAPNIIPSKSQRFLV